MSTYAEYNENPPPPDAGERFSARRAWDFFASPMDPWLFWAMLAIYLMSLILLYSADGQDFGLLENKTVHTALGFCLLWAIAKIKPYFLSNFALPVYALSLAMLLGVHFFGVNVNGSTRWLDFGVVRIQPSEIMKIALPMTLAWYFQKYEGDVNAKRYLIAIALIAAPCYFVFKQPDLGTTLLIFASGAFVIFFVGLPWKAILIALAGTASALPLAWTHLLHDYQRERILMLFDPTQDKLGSGYHITQSKIAIGSGGLWGKGWLNGSQTHLDYIPESTTDFIFAVYSEEFGFIGNAILIALYTALISRGFWIALKARTLYERALSASLTMILFCYVFVNMGMVSGLLPVVGVPLPLVSYGGTSTLTIMIILAMLMSVSNRYRKTEFD